MSAGEGRDGRIRLMMELRRAGVADTATLSAIERLPREQFVHPDDQALAWSDAMVAARPDWPRVTRPLHAGVYLQALGLGGRQRTLQVPTGSGYLAALLAGFCRWVYSVDAGRPTRQAAEQRFRALKISNIVTRTGDPLSGWPEQAPFDRIVVDAVVAAIPTTLQAQLRDGGSMVVPIGDDKHATITRVLRTGDSFSAESIVRAVFTVPHARN